MYNVHTWAGIASKDLASLSNHLREPIGVLLKGPLLPETKLAHTTDEMFPYAGVLPLQDQVHANRLRFLARLIDACPKFTWSLIFAHQGEGSWHDLCMQSLQPHSVSWTTMQTWIQHIALDTRWKGRIRKTVKLALAYHQSNAEHAICRCQDDRRRRGTSHSSHSPCNA